MKYWTKQQYQFACLNAFFLTLVAVIVLYALHDIEGKTKASISESLHTVLHTTQGAQQIWINQRMQEAKALANNALLIRRTRELIDLYDAKKPIHKSESLTGLRDLLRPHIEKHNDKGFFIISLNRINVASMRDGNIGLISLIHQQRPALLDKTLSGHTVLVPPIRSDVPLDADTNPLYDRIPTMFVVTPIVDDLNRIFALLAIRIDPSLNFTRITQLGRVGETGETYGFDENGFLITESRFDHHLRRIGLINAGEKGMLTIRITDPGGNLLEGYSLEKSRSEKSLTAMAADAITGNNGHNIEGYRDYRGVPVFGAWLWDSTLNFGLTTEIDVEEALQPYYYAKNALLSVVTITVVLCFIMQFMVFRLQRESKLKMTAAYSEMEMMVRQRTQDLETAKEKLSQSNKELEQLAISDSLTQLSNRRHFENHLGKEWDHCLRDNKSIALIIFDIDYFKPYNDTYGHQAGDDCLMQIASTLHQAYFAKRPGDMIARYGGEEFVIILSDTNEAYTKKVAQDILESIRQLKMPHRATKVKDQNILTISVGSAIVSELDKSNVKSLIHQADSALYEAKAKGRNNHRHYSNDNPSNLLHFDKR